MDRRGSMAVWSSNHDGFYVLSIGVIFLRFHIPVQVAHLSVSLSFLYFYWLRVCSVVMVTAHFLVMDGAHCISVSRQLVAFRNSIDRRLSMHRVYYSCCNNMSQSALIAKLPFYRRSTGCLEKTRDDHSGAVHGISNIPYTS